MQTYQLHGVQILHLPCKGESPLSLVSCALHMYFSFLIRLQFISFFTLFLDVGHVRQRFVNDSSTKLRNVSSIFCNTNLFISSRHLIFSKVHLWILQTWTTAKRDYLLTFIMRYNRLSSSWWKATAVYTPFMVLLLVGWVAWNNKPFPLHGLFGNKQCMLFCRQDLLPAVRYNWNRRHKFRISDKYIYLPGLSSLHKKYSSSKPGHQKT